MPDAAVVLCGGRSSRMGSPKALLDWKGRTMVAHVVGILREAVDEVVVVSSPELLLPPVDATVVLDREPGLGPLAGLRDGLEAVNAELAFVTAVDAPFLTARFVRAMLAFRETAVVEVDGILQPLCAAYATSVAADAALLLSKGRRSLQELLAAVPHRTLRPGLLPDPDSLRGVNTPEEYRAALLRPVD